MDITFPDMQSCSGDDNEQQMLEAMYPGQPLIYTGRIQPEQQTFVDAWRNMENSRPCTIYHYSKYE